MSNFPHFRAGLTKLGLQLSGQALDRQWAMLSFRRLLSNPNCAADEVATTADGRVEVASEEARAEGCLSTAKDPLGSASVIFLI